MLVIHEETKFVFAHRGGKAAAEAVLNDTFTNNRLMRRAIALQVFTTLSVGIGAVKGRTYLAPVAIISLLGNLCYEYPIVSSGVRLYLLSSMVRDGNIEVWENLNEARYVQRLEEMYSPEFKYPRKAGIYGTLACITYLTPALGLLIYTFGYYFSLHKKLQ